MTFTHKLRIAHLSVVLAALFLVLAPLYVLSSAVTTTEGISGQICQEINWNSPTCSKLKGLGEERKEDGQ